MTTYTMHSGAVVLSKDGTRPSFYLTQAQAIKAAAKIEGAQAIKHPIGTSYMVQVTR
jgi:hypothetical protein